MTDPSRPLWVPSPERVSQARLTAFAREVERRFHVHVPDYAALHRFSIARPADFWQAFWDVAAVRGIQGERAVSDPGHMPGAQFFPDGKLSFVENVLRRRDDAPAVIFSTEGERHRTLTHAELYREVSRFASALRREGVGSGDRVAGYVPNIPEAVVAALGTAAVGAIWSSCSPDFGVQGVVDRFGQIDARILVTTDGYVYAGKRHDLLTRLKEIVPRLGTVSHAVVFPYLDDQASVSGVPRGVTWAEFLGHEEGTGLLLERFPFNHPLYILYSSGTTGIPKCVVHGAGGTLVTHMKEHQLHCDIRRDDRVFYFTTCGWMMWNWLVTALASEATLVLYDGSPFHPSGSVLFDLADDTLTTLFGTSAKYIDAVNKAGLSPIETHRLDTVRTIASTGSPLAPESFDFVYTSIKADVHLASIAGGTDIVGCFVGGDPTGPVWRGEIQRRLLGMDVKVFDEEGRAIDGQKGELVCAAPFPSMPIGFWNDPGDRKYHAAYFEKFPGVWCHGDYVEITSHDGVIIHGRSDAVLNPGGVRIGTAEIYRQVEQLDDVVESLAIGQRWGNDERIVLFVRLRDGLHLTPEIEDRIRRRIRENATPRHVPARIVQVSEIPRTRSGKIVELAVRDVVHGRDVRNREALANPESLQQFRDREELRS